MSTKTARRSACDPVDCLVCTDCDAGTMQLVKEMAYVGIRTSLSKDYEA